jgi:16S rRNA G966 N2-methylase RsmD
MRFFYLLSAVTIFVSSFLLFQVQPLLGKHILPWYGGSSAVWVSAMFFFMVVLAVGYIYALVLSRLSLWYQGVVHSVFVALSGALVFIHAQEWPSAITPLATDVTVSIQEPVWSVFLLLSIAIGLPFILLSATSSLVQLWYAKLSNLEPFSLYSISNIGSLLGLLSYPILFEPFFTTYTQGQWWGYGFVVYLLLLAIIIFFVLRQARTGLLIVSTSTEAEVSRVSVSRFLVWTMVAAVPVMVLLSGTTFMTTAVAPVPLLWVGPLALYLASFIFTFREGWRPATWVNEFFVVAAAIAALGLSVVKVSSVTVTVLVTHLALFAISHWCHEYLYRLRPVAASLTTFYVALSLGGIVGSLLIKVSYSYLLTIPLELVVILVVSVFFVAWRWVMAEAHYVPGVSKFVLKSIALAAVLVVGVTSVVHLKNMKQNVVAAERNFFGYKAIVEKPIHDLTMRAMQHGLTNHGFQLIENGVPKIEAVAYYSSTSGIGKTFSYIRSAFTTPQIAVAGLGGGGLAAYCRSGDSFTFVEIDAEVTALAKKYFTYLDACDGYTLISGDARLVFSSLPETEQGAYELMILDAYADDMMPAHLMTTEAVALYKKLLADDGVLAVHISSRYLELLPVLIALADDNDMAIRHWFDRTPSPPLATMSEWVLLAKDEVVFANEAFAGMDTPDMAKAGVLWTDTYSALLPVLRF